MKKAGYFVLLFLTLYATSCSDMNEVKSSRQDLNKNDIKPIKSLTIGENKYVIGWQSEGGNNVNYRGIPKQLFKEESNGIENSPGDLERDNSQVTNNNSESNATQRKIKGYQATIDPNTGAVVTYPIYEDD